MNQDQFYWGSRLPGPRKQKLGKRIEGQRLSKRSASPVSSATTATIAQELACDHRRDIANSQVVDITHLEAMSVFETDEHRLRLISGRHSATTMRGRDQAAISGESEALFEGHGHITAEKSEALRPLEPAPSILNRASPSPKTSSSALITTFLPHLPRTLCLVFVRIILHAAVVTILAAVMHRFNHTFRAEAVNNRWHRKGRIGGGEYQSEASQTYNLQHDRHSYLASAALPLRILALQSVSIYVLKTKGRAARPAPRRQSPGLWCEPWGAKALGLPQHIFHPPRLDLAR
jgi:hypothetical protein